MALYDYRCEDCGEEFEFAHPMSESPRVKCPTCGMAHTRRLISFPHVRLNWKAWDRNETGSDKMVIRSAKRGKSTPRDGWAGKEYLDHRRRARE